MNVVFLHPKTKEEIEEYISHPSHAVLLVGRVGVGKSYLSKHLTKKLTGEDQARGNTHTYDGAEAGIENVREIINKLKLKTLDKSKRVIIIENIDRLGHEAQNALLKILEEPPDDTFFVGTASELNAVLPTVVSRMTVLHVRPLNLSGSQEHFKNIASAQEIEKAYHLSGGQIGLMNSILTSEDHELGEAIDWAKKILKLSRYERLLLADELAKTDKDKLKDYFGALQKILRATILHGEPLTQPEAKRRVAQLEATITAQESLRSNVSPKLVLTGLFLTL